MVLAALEGLLEGVDSDERADILSLDEGPRLQRRLKAASPVDTGRLRASINVLTTQVAGIAPPNPANPITLPVLEVQMEFYGYLLNNTPGGVHQNWIGRQLRGIISQVSFQDLEGVQYFVSPA